MIEDTLGHVIEEHEDDVAETYPTRYLTDTDYAFILYYKYDHNPEDHDHSCMPRTGEEY